MSIPSRSWPLSPLWVFLLTLLTSPNHGAEQTNDHLQLTVVMSKGAVFRAGRVMQIDLVLTNKSTEVRTVHYLNSNFTVDFEIRDAKGDLVERNLDKAMRISNWYGTKDLAAHESLTFPFGLNAQYVLKRGRYSLKATMTEIMENKGKSIRRPITSQQVRFEVR